MRPSTIFDARVLSITYYQFQFQLFVCFYSTADRTWTNEFPILDSKLASKTNFSTYSYCEWIIYQSSPGITLIHNMTHMRG